MMHKLSDLEERQRVLQERAAQERAEVAVHFEAIEKPLSWADKGIDAFNFVKGNPLIWTSAFAMLAHFKPKIASKILTVGWGTMKLLKSAKTLL
ncbi:YqjK-like family protein [Polynucleobacter sp. CS-Odin-A6]|uniref:YqjK family protein n=1 Tax=Polynucleobacter sp. CS-Odin-A6 TaxID=2689106 RepID=UPI001C0E6A44|nr:YqjK-like family protein [Polynucleobacter sp. CS-Odin-A6]MBU3621561.1 YqjK-like family protein [Polynucleobacter sp. CS-Odin-A6]